MSNELLGGDAVPPHHISLSIHVSDLRIMHYLLSYSVQGCSRYGAGEAAFGAGNVYLRQLVNNRRAEHY